MIWLLKYLARLIYQDDWLLLRANFEKQVVSANHFLQTDPYENLFHALVRGEDHRFYIHHGVDFLSMFRAIAVYIRWSQLQGASTITQQLVRRLTNRYQRTLRRKFKEVLLATLLDAEFSKLDIIKTYLHVAYYGWRMNGMREALRRQQLVPPLSDMQAAAIVARLKYPEPQFAEPTLLRAIERRAAYIERLMQEKY